MPIEIRELIIRATVEPPKGGGASPAAATDKSSGNMNDKARDAIIQECVEQVLEILKRLRLR